MIWTPFEMGRVVSRRSRPSRDSMEQSIRFLQQAIKDSGLSPGLYRKPSDVDYDKLSSVHVHLCETLEREIRELDVLDLCSRLYRLHDTFLTSARILTNEQATLIHAVRSLIELAIRSCGSSGVFVDEDHYDYLLSLGYQAIGWDAIWDQLSSPVFPQAIQIEEDYRLRPIPNLQASKAVEDYERYLSARARLNEIHQDHPSIVPVTDFGRESAERMLANSDIAGIDSCLVEQIGYSLADYITFVGSLAQISIDTDLDICVLARDRFIADCHELRGVSISSSQELIRDFALSVESVRHVPVGALFSVGRRNRDSRFVRRPVAALNHEGTSMLMFGRASLLDTHEFLMKQVMFGRMPVQRWSDNEEVTAAFGEVQGAVGGPLKKAVAEACEKILGPDRVYLEKGAISSVKSPSDLGPIDIFLIDDDRKRFILVEIKNSAAAGGDPLSMKDEYLEFANDFLPTLRRKTDWFQSKLRELKREYSIPDQDEYSVQGVIVVNQQRLWVLTQEDRLPILDDDEFLEKLGKGDALLSDPVAEPQ